MLNFRPAFCQRNTALGSPILLADGRGNMVHTPVMSSDPAAPFHAWFAAYCRTFDTKHIEDLRNLRLKEEHTSRVCDNAVRIAADLHLPVREALLAEISALFHDVGRFPQYQQYKTYRDSASVNHAALGASVLLKQDVLRGLPPQEQQTIVRVVALHNAFAVPPGLDAGILRLVEIVRDADKLDIWDVFIEYLAQDPADRPTAVGLELPDVPEYSEAVMASLRRREMVRLDSLRTINDFKLLQLAWIYDLNTPPALRILEERNIIARLGATLPANDETSAAIDALHAHVNGRLRTSC